MSASSGAWCSTTLPGSSATPTPTSCATRSPTRCSARRGLGDIGSHFPDTDPAWAGADSVHLLAAVVDMVAAEGWRVANVDCSVIAERPKLAPHRRAIELKLSSVAGGPVTVKGRHAEQLGAIGRSEGVVCLASALLEAD